MFHARVAEWQTHQLEVLAVAILCGFKSHPSHQKKQSSHLWGLCFFGLRGEDLKELGPVGAKTTGRKHRFLPMSFGPAKTHPIGGGILLTNAPSLVEAKLSASYISTPPYTQTRKKAPDGVPVLFCRAVGIPLTSHFTERDISSLFYDRVYSGLHRLVSSLIG